MVSISFLIGLAMIGIVAGFASGLLGVGGGFLMVPLQYFLLTSSGVNPDLAMMVSLGTSLAIIIPTASSGAYEHQKKNRDIVRPGMLLGVFGIFGSFCGGLLANVVPSDILRFIFGILLFIVAVDMLVGFKREGNGTRVPFTKFTAMARSICRSFAFHSFWIHIEGSYWNIFDFHCDYCHWWCDFIYHIRLRS